MNKKKFGSQSYQFPNPPVIKAWASIAGPKEAQGPLKNTYDYICEDAYFGQKTWEQGEQHMQQLALKKLSDKAGIILDDIQLVLSGDLLNQCIGSSFALKNKNIPFLGLYGACSTMAESILVGSLIVSGGFADQVVAMTSSHFASSERQYRFPLNYGGQRPPTSQWTVTGSGSVLLSSAGTGPKVTECTIGTVVDLGITDANNMGAAMAPAANATIRVHLQDFQRRPDDYDLIVTGDLGQTGAELLRNLCIRDGFSIGGRHIDCGTMVYNLQAQDTHSGGSGCGCSAIVLCGYLLEKLRSQTLKRILFCGTGALLSPTSTQQGLPIPGICHAVTLECE